LLYYRYEIDDISPLDGMYEDECYYWILSKVIKPKPSASTSVVPVVSPTTAISGKQPNGSVEVK